MLNKGPLFIKTARNSQVFQGPSDNKTPKKQMFEPPVEAKVLRIRPLTWHEEIAVRFELIGCREPSKYSIRHDSRWWNLHS